MSAVFVGMPCYNSGGFLAKAIDSLMSQTFCDFQLLISDNKSTDNSFEIARYYASKDPRIAVVQQPQNIGAADNFNYLLGKADSQYIMFAGSHDYWSSNYLATLYSALECDTSAVVSYGNLSRTGDVIKNGQFLDGDSFECTEDEPVVRAVNVVYKIQSCHMVYGLLRTSGLKKCRINMKCIGPDHVLLAELALRGKILYCPEVTLFMRQVREEPMDETEFRRKQLMRITGKDDVEKELKNRYRDWWLQHLISSFNVSGSLWQRCNNVREVSRAFVDRWTYQMPRYISLPYRLFIPNKRFDIYSFFGRCFFKK